MVRRIRPRLRQNPRMKRGADVELEEEPELKRMDTGEQDVLILKLLLPEKGGTKEHKGPSLRRTQRRCEGPFCALAALLFSETPPPPFSSRPGSPTSPARPSPAHHPAPPPTRLLGKPFQVGNVIGKAGSILKSLEAETGTRIRISAIDEVIPSTNERIATISGGSLGMPAAARRVCAILFPEEAATAESTLKLLMPHAAIGVVISRGAPSRRLRATSGTIKISQPPAWCRHGA